LIKIGNFKERARSPLVKKAGWFVFSVPYREGKTKNYASLFRLLFITHIYF